MSKSVEPLRVEPYEGIQPGRAYLVSTIEIDQVERHRIRQEILRTGESPTMKKVLERAIYEKRIVGIDVRDT